MPKRVRSRAIYYSDPTGGDELTGYTGSVAYRVRLAADIAAKAELGFEADDPAAPTLPRGLQMRRIVGRTADGARSISLPCGSIVAPAFANPATTISMDQWDESGNYTLVMTGKVGEARTW